SVPGRRSLASGAERPNSTADASPKARPCARESRPGAPIGFLRPTRGQAISITGCRPRWKGHDARRGYALARMSDPPRSRPRIDARDRWRSAGIPPARWPTREEARASLLFSPIRLGSRTSRTRTWVPAMVPWRSVEEGFVTPDILDWYGRFADG